MSTDQVSTSESDTTPQSSPATAATWLIVTQVKSERVVYFTDDPHYQPPTEGDWYYVSPYQGDLPKGMSLRNCWGWRFRGMAFADAREKPKPNSAQALIEHNRDALHKVLREKIDTWRRRYAPKVVGGDTLRAQRVAEAEQLLSGADPESLQLLPHSAAARGITLHEMAQRTLAARDACRETLIQSELLRDELAQAITASESQDELIQLRERLMNLLPEHTALYKTKVENTTPQKIARQPAADELAQERLRLRVQLRLKVNSLRRACVSDYLLDDVVLKHKGQVAQAVLANGGAIPAGLDAGVLISHAAARGQTLLAAAREVLSEMNETARVLLDTEQMKDALLSQISAIQTFADVERVSRVTQKLAFAPPPLSTRKGELS